MFNRDGMRHQSVSPHNIYETMSRSRKRITFLRKIARRLSAVRFHTPHSLLISFHPSFFLCHYKLSFYHRSLRFPVGPLSHYPPSFTHIPHMGHFSNWVCMSWWMMSKYVSEMRFRWLSMTKSVPAERNEMFFNCWGAARLRTLLSAKIAQNFD